MAHINQNLSVNSQLSTISVSTSTQNVSGNLGSRVTNVRVAQQSETIGLSLQNPVSAPANKMQRSISTRTITHHANSLPQIKSKKEPPPRPDTPPSRTRSQSQPDLQTTKKKAPPRPDAPPSRTRSQSQPDLQTTKKKAPPRPDSPPLRRSNSQPDLQKTSTDSIYENINIRPAKSKEISNLSLKKSANLPQNTKQLSERKITIAPKSKKSRMVAGFKEFKKSPMYHLKQGTKNILNKSKDAIKAKASKTVEYGKMAKELAKETYKKRKK